MNKKHLDNLDLFELAEGIMEDRTRIVKNIETLWEMAHRKAKAETEYKKVYAQVVLQLRNEGMPATIVRDVAEGEVSEQKLEMEISAALFRASLAALEALQTNINALQSVLKHLDKV